YKVVGTFIGFGTAEMVAERGRMPHTVLPEKEELRVRDITLNVRQTVARRNQKWELLRHASPAERAKIDDELKSIAESIQRLESEKSALIEEARLRQHVYVGIEYPRAATVEEVQSELDPGVALLEFAVDGEEVFAFVTTRASQRLVPLGDAASVLEVVERV